MKDEPIQQKSPTPTSSHKSNHEAHQGQLPWPIWTDAAPESQPTPTKYEITCKTEKTKWDKSKPFVELGGLVLLAIYTCYTIRMYHANKESADAAKSAAETASGALGQSQQ